jgi:hypothetical protein
MESLSRQIYYLKRKSWDNRWDEIDKNTIKDIKYGLPYIGANALFIGIIKKNL